MKGMTMGGSKSMGRETSGGRRRHTATFLLVLLAAIGCFALSALAAQAEELKLLNLYSKPLNEDLSPNTEAGGHPFQLTTSFEVNEAEVPPGSGNMSPAENLRDAATQLPPGLIGNAQLMPKCRQENMNELGNCSQDAQVGIAHLKLQFLGPPFFVEYPIYNLVPPRGMPAQFGMVVISSITHIDFHVRSESDYGVSATLHRINGAAPLYGSTLEIWGVPGDPSHDEHRIGTPPAEPLKRLPLLSNPTSCTGPLLTTIAVNTWQSPGHEVPGVADADGMTGCDQPEFNPTVEAKPTTNQADSPTGFNFHLHLPQNQDPDGRATAELKDARVTLPPGLTINPASANGLGSCSPAQIHLLTPVGQANAHFSEAAANCPNSSKIGSVRIDTPVLDHPLTGDVYLATQEQNPFGSLLGLYLAVDDSADSGVTMKLAGRVEPDPATGQLTAVFAENPQLPFEDLNLEFFEGSTAALKTPMGCDTFTTSTRMTPWTTPEGADATPSDSFKIDHGNGGGACVSSEAAAPKTLKFDAGTLDPTAGVYSPFNLRIARADGTQQITGLDATMPKGLIARLAGIPYCSDGALAAAANSSGRQEQANPSCPAASRVGGVNVGAGAGPTPFYASGNVYLAGPYKGAPVSIAIVTPAVAGPFDLGTVVVRTALYVDPETTQVRAVSDPIPSILRGIPLDIRSVAVNLDRSQFTRNPTSCSPFAITGVAAALTGQSVPLSSRFQVGECASLGFAPKLALSLKGGTKRSDHPALKAVLTTTGKEANIARAAVTLPRSEFLENAHIRNVCTRVQFAAGACPASSIYGTARAFTPLLDKPIEGPVYLRSSNNQLPDLVADLKGQINVVLDGRIDSVHRGIRNTFELVPDAPVSKFVLEMKGGKKGLLVNNRNLCKSTNRATVLFDGHNGKTADSQPLVKNSCKKGGGKKSSGKKKRHGHG
jgi:hypothetical protein